MADKQADRLADRQADRQADKQAKMQAGRQAGKMQAGRLADRGRQADRQAKTHAGRQVDMLKTGKTDSQKGKEAYKQNVRRIKESRVCRQLVRHRWAGNMHTVMQKMQPEWQVGKSSRPKPDMHTSRQKYKYIIVNALYA